MFFISARMWLTDLDILVSTLNIYSSSEYFLNIGQEKKTRQESQWWGVWLSSAERRFAKISSILIDFYLSHIRTEIVHLDKPSLIQHRPFYTVMNPSR